MPNFGKSDSCVTVWNIGNIGAGLPMAGGRFACRLARFAASAPARLLAPSAFCGVARNDVNPALCQSYWAAAFTFTVLNFLKNNAASAAAGNGDNLRLHAVSGFN